MFENEKYFVYTGNGFPDMFKVFVLKYCYNKTSSNDAEATITLNYFLLDKMFFTTPSKISTLIVLSWA